MLCSKCHTANRVPGQRWCRECLTEYQRQRRQRTRSTLETIHHNLEASSLGRQPHPLPYENGGAQRSEAVAMPSVIHPAALTTPAPKIHDLRAIDTSKCLAVPRDGRAPCPNCGWPRVQPREPHVVLGPG